MKFYEANEYQERINMLFGLYKPKINHLLPNARVEHIGSSSVPGAISKGDLDVFVGVNPHQVECSVLALRGLGFLEKKNTLRTPELCMLELSESNIAVQVVANGSEYEFFIEFRNALLNSTKLLSAYNQLKKNCAGCNETEYREIKSKFILEVINKA